MPPGDVMPGDVMPGDVCVVYKTTRKLEKSMLCHCMMSLYDSKKIGRHI